MNKNTLKRKADSSDESTSKESENVKRFQFTSWGPILEAIRTGNLMAQLKPVGRDDGQPSAE